MQSSDRSLAKLQAPCQHLWRLDIYIRVSTQKTAFAKRTLKRLPKNHPPPLIKHMLRVAGLPMCTLVIIWPASLLKFY
jgi:hypothetical protein